MNLPNELVEYIKNYLKHEFENAITGIELYSELGKEYEEDIHILSEAIKSITYILSEIEKVENK